MSPGAAPLEDPAQKLYKKESVSYDLNRDVEPCAMWSFGLSVAPFFVGFIPIINILFAPAPFVALVLGIISLQRIKKNPDTYKDRGFAIAGIVISSILVLLVLLAVFFFATVIASFF